MFINEIDTFIDLQFNYVKEYGLKHKFTKNLKKDPAAFVQYYEKITDSIDFTNIFSNIHDDKNKQKVRNIIEKYILFYLLLHISIYEDNFHDEDEKNFVEKLFTISNSLHILDSVIIGELLEIYQGIYICITLINFLKEKKDLPINNDTTELVQIFNEIGLDIIVKFFDITKKENLHNILVTLIYRKLYIKNDKKELANIIEENSFENAEYKYITVINSRIKEIDFASMEMLFDIESRKNGLPDDYYNLINDYQKIILGDIQENLNPANLLSNDHKISYLFHKKILIPITDEILRYHLNEEKYVSETSENVSKTKQEYKKVDTKLNYIINKINIVTEHARNELTRKLYYQPLTYRQAIPYNDIEEMKIIKKFADIGRINAENVNTFMDLLSFRVYPYINYHDYAYNGFNHKHTYTTDALRYSNFRYNKNKDKSILNKYMDWRVITHDNFHTENKHNFNSNIVGIALPTYIDNSPYNIRCLKINKSINVRKYNVNGYVTTTKILEDIILNNKTCKKTPFWIFDENTDKFTQDVYEDINDEDKPKFFKKLIGKIYDNVENLTLNRILSTYKLYAPLTLYQSKQLFDIITNRFVPISQYSNKIGDINYARYFTYLPQRVNTDDIRDVTFSRKELIKLFEYKQPKKNNQIVTIQKTEKIDESILEKYNAVCQHIVTLEDIQRIRERDPTLFSQKLNNFYKKFILDKKNSNFICKSCFEFVNIDKYIEQFDGLIKISAESKVPLDEQIRYSKFGKAIASLDKIIERMADIFNLTEYTGIKSSAILKRRETIRQLIDILISSQELRVQNPGDFDSTFNMLSDVVGTKYSEYFAFPFENDIFVYSSRDTDKFKRKKYNTILSHIAVLMLLDISNSNILYFRPDKLINIMIFEKYGLGTLDNLKLRINTSNDLVHLGNYLLMGYVIYYMASMMIRFKVYETENPDVDVKKGIPLIDRLRIMHTITHILAIIIDRESKSTGYLYTILKNNYFIKLSTVYNSQNSESVLKEIRHANEKKIENLQNNLNKKLVTKQQTYQSIDGKFNYSIYNSNNPDIVKSLDIYKKLYPIKIVKDTFQLSKDDTIKMIQSNLYGMYKQEQSLLKLNIDIFALDKYRSQNKLYEVKNKYIENINNLIQQQKKELFKIQSKKLKITDKLDKTYVQLQSDLLPFNDILDTFILKLEKYISDNQTIFKDDFYLRKSIFIINHDFAGFPITPFKVDKISIKYNDTITKRDVIVYREKVTERYYDVYTLAYLGYKTPTTEFIPVKNHQYIIIKHSLVDKIKYMGLYSKYINILPLDKKLVYTTNYRGDIIYNNTELVNQIVINKIQHDKILIEKFQRIIYSIRNKKIRLDKKDETDVSKNNEKILINEFIPRLSNLKILNNDFELFLQNWKNTCLSYKIKPTNNINLINRDTFHYVDSDIINNEYSNLIRYLLIELIKLIDMNTDKTNINLCNLISMIFDSMWEDYAPKNNYEVNKFLLILYTGIEDYMVSLSNSEDIAADKPLPEDINKLPETEKQKIADEAEDFKEEQDALDTEPTDEEDLDLGEQDVIMHDRDN